jgi:hypothetical protein
MRAGVALCIAFALWSSAASAATYYRYRDRSTGRDVFVSGLDQVPRQYRKHAKIVLETDEATAPPAPAPADAPASASDEPVAKPAPPPAPRSEPAPGWGEIWRRLVSSDDLLRDVPVLACTLVDANLAKHETRPLDVPERNDLASLLSAIFIAALIASAVALIAWIVILVTAVRDGRLWWAFFIFIFWPLAYLYAFIHGGKGRVLWKTLCSLALLAPAVVGVVAAWRIYDWWHAVMRARSLSF